MTNKYGGYNVEEFNKIFKYVSESWIKNALKKKSEVYGMNENMESMITELKNEFPKIYDRVNHGLYILAIDEDGKVYEDEPGFDEKIVEEIQIIYNGNTVSVYPNYINKCSIRFFTVKYEDLDIITKAIAIVGKHLKNIDQKES